MIRRFQIFVCLQSKAVYINYSSHMIKLNSGQECSYNLYMHLKVPHCLWFLWEHSFKFQSFLSYLLFARTKCPNKVRFAQTNRLNGQKLSDVWLLFQPLRYISVIGSYISNFNPMLHYWVTVYNHLVTLQ